MPEDVNSSTTLNSDNQINEQFIGNDDTNMITSWYTLNNQDYFLAYTTIPHIPSGLYEITVNEDYGIGLSNVTYNTDELYLLPGVPYTGILQDLALFLVLHLFYQ